MSAKVKDTQDKLRIVTEFCSLWNQYFQFFAEDQEALRESPEIDAAMLGMTQQLAYKHYELSERLYTEFEGSASILAILKKNVSIAHLKTLPESEFDRMQVAWHEIFLALNRARGKLDHALPQKVREEMHAKQRGQSKTVAAA